MSIDEPHEITVALAPALHALCSDAVGPRVEGMLAGILADLGLSGRPVVAVEQRDVPFLRMEVDGHACRYPDTVIPECAAYVLDDAAIAPALDADALAARLVRASRADELVELACAAAVWSGPAVLSPGSHHREQLELGVPVDGPFERATVELHVERRYLREITSGERAADLFEYLRSELSADLGIRLPDFHLVADRSLRRRAFAFRVNAAWTIPRIALREGVVLVDTAVGDLPDLVDDARPTVNPATGRPAAIVPARHAVDLELAGHTTWDSLAYLIFVAATVLRRAAPALIGIDTADAVRDDMERAFPHAAAVTDELGSERLALVLRVLMASGMRLRNRRRVLQLLARRPMLPEQAATDMVTFIRGGSADQIGHQLAHGTGTVPVFLVNPDVQDAIAGGAGPEWPYTELGERVSDALRDAADRVPRDEPRPIVLTTDALRGPLLQALRVEHPLFEVAGFGDLPPGCNVKPVGRIGWPDPGPSPPA